MTLVKCFTFKMLTFTLFGSHDLSDPFVLSASAGRPNIFLDFLKKKEL